MTAIFNSNEYLQKGFDLGAIDYITKPIEENLLVSKLKNYIDIFKLQKSLIQSENYTKTILNAQPTITIVSNGEKASFINSTFFNTFNYKDLDDFNAQHYCISELFIDKKDGQYLQTIMNGVYWIKYIENTTNKYNLCFMLDKDNNERIFDIRVNGQVFEEKIIVLTDITDVLNYEKQARELQGQFLSNMSHEIRTPLNGIAGYIDFLSETNLDKQQEEYIDIISQSSNMLKVIINDILDFSKLKAGKLDIYQESTKIKDKLHFISNLLGKQIKDKNIEFTIDIDKNLPELIVVDLVRLQQIITNLVSNAIKFTNNGGKILFKIEVINSNQDNIEVRYLVKDDGIGIAQDKLETILEPFSQAQKDTSKIYGGTGLGLSVTKGILEIFGSKLELSSKVDLGSEFSFILKSELPKDNKAAKTVSLVKSDFEKLNILIAEDNPINQMVIKALLDMRNIQSTLCEDGQKVVDEYKLNYKNYNLIFMDMFMPVKDGMEASIEIMEYEKENNLPHTPIVAVTANVIGEDVDKYLNIGMDDYLAKPINKTILDKILGKFC